VVTDNNVHSGCVSKQLAPPVLAAIVRGERNPKTPSSHMFAFVAAMALVPPCLALLIFEAIPLHEPYSGTF
jgi:hypothetical protein